GRRREVRERQWFRAEPRGHIRRGRAAEESTRLSARVGRHAHRALALEADGGDTRGRVRAAVGRDAGARPAVDDAGAGRLRTAATRGLDTRRHRTLSALWRTDTEARMTTTYRLVALAELAAPILITALG